MSIEFLSVRFAREAGVRWSAMANDPARIDVWLQAHGLTDSASPADVLAAVGHDYQEYATLGGRWPSAESCPEH
jgi:hypothetical protein